MRDIESFLRFFKKNFKPHPWHGISYGPDADGFIEVYIEIVPSDTVKYELDKETGYLKIDRPQKFSNIIPSLYGFIPQTYASTHVAKRAIEVTKRKGLIGDGDPLDICVLTEKAITHGDILVKAKPIGGFRMLDQGEVDDKIVAVLKDDPIFGGISDVSECPDKILARLKHYFLTYKNIPGEEEHQCEIHDLYGREEANNIIQNAQKER